MAEFTPAQKSAITRSAKAQKQRLDDIAFVSKNLPPRKAKQTAKKNAIESDEEEPEPKAKSKAKASTARKYVPAPITIDTDESEPEAPKKAVRIDFTKLPLSVKAKSKAAAVNLNTVKTKVVKAPSAAVAAKITASSRKPVKMVAESASEEEEESAGSGDNSDDADDADKSDDSEAENDDDDGPDPDEFIQEVPRVITGTGGRTSDDLEDVDSGSETGEIDEAPLKNSGKGAKNVPAPEELFESEEDEDDAMPAAPPRRFAKPHHMRDDSDIAMHEAIADALVSVPRRAHSRRSSTGSGWSSGNDLVIPESEPDSNAASEPEVPAPRPAKKVTAARQRKADLERPEVRPAPAPPLAANRNLAADTSEATRAESTWHVSTRLALPAPNKAIGLTAQTPEVQLVCRGTMDEIKISLFFTEFFPVLAARAGFVRPIMITVAERDAVLVHVLERLRSDPNFAAILACIPLDRINITRGDTKRCAVNVVMTMYKLTDLTPAEVKARVEDLLKDHRYIFPVDSKTGQMQLSLPFHHSSIKFILKDQIMSSPIFKGRNYGLFPATHPDRPDAREVADPMVAISATAVYASLLELRMTGERQPMAFTEDAFEDIYRIHIKTLEDTRKNAKKALHRVLHSLFTDVTITTRAVQTASGSSATLISLVDVPDSD